MRLLLLVIFVAMVVIAGSLNAIVSMSLPIGGW